MNIASSRSKATLRKLLSTAVLTAPRRGEGAIGQHHSGLHQSRGESDAAIQSDGHRSNQHHRHLEGLRRHRGQLDARHHYAGRFI